MRAFLIRNKNYTRPAWWAGGLEWTYDTNKAIRFCRAIDAERVVDMGVGTRNTQTEQYEWTGDKVVQVNE